MVFKNMKDKQIIERKLHQGTKPFIDSQLGSVWDTCGLRLLQSQSLLSRSYLWVEHNSWQSLKRRVLIAGKSLRNTFYYRMVKPIAGKVVELETKVNTLLIHCVLALNKVKSSCRHILYRKRSTPLCSFNRSQKQLVLSLIYPHTVFHLSQSYR